MFAITPFQATRYAVVIKGDRTAQEWQPCRVVGVDASGEEPKYIVEIRSADGSSYLDKADLIRKPAPTNQA
ncbi:hypothetical protein [Rhizobium sp. NLR22b]|uniref:hypothetical protein n=1 Tax=Rhizobium sp. NLR22b TaxID=2731115 RepID=UPI001C83F7C6|nr:hypothetical protein [Rhizobium sp. NLR22b]MBX5239514.1 hypothetical protein [Rhizobium sp. NLR22b]